MGGDSAQAIDTYKNILSTEPTNEDALFGLASTYHRLGNLESARPYYGRLLKINPTHREGLNNFLALVSDESPQEALAELERLEQRNPDFSPIPAQQSLVLAKLGYADQAREKILRAIELSPDNLTYKYNLAVMLDKQGRYADAGALYRLLIDASLKGQKIPASLDILQKRLNFITTAAAPTASSGG
jgi:Flp pilus assembly protein TadD